MQFLSKLPCFSRMAVNRCQHPLTARLTLVRETKSSAPVGVRIRPYKSNRRAMGMTLLILPITTFCLGTWQVKRYYWKIGLIEELERKTSSEPIPLPQDLSELQNMEYLPIKVRGTFDYSKEAIIEPRTCVDAPLYNQQKLTQNVGYHTVVPFKLADRDLTIMVNRGWLHQDRKKEKDSNKGKVYGEIELTGILRLSDKKSKFFTVDGGVDGGHFIRRRLDEISEYLGTAEVFLDADAKSTVPGGPIGGQTPIKLRNEHLSYIIIWYSLAIIGTKLCYDLITKGQADYFTYFIRKAKRIK